MDHTVQIYAVILFFSGGGGGTGGEEGVENYVNVRRCFLRLSH